MADPALALQQRSDGILVTDFSTWWGGRGGWFRRRQLVKQQLTQGWRIESSILPDVIMAGTVRAERGIIDASRIIGGMAAAAGWIEHIPVKRDPVWILVRIGFRAAADLNFGDKISGSGYDRDGMAQVAFQADGFPIGVQMLASVTAETPGCI